MSIQEFQPRAQAGRSDGARRDTGSDRGAVARVSGSVVGISGLRRARLFDMVQVGDQRLPGEIIRLTADEALAQIYEPPSGLRAGDPVIGIGAPLSIELGPGLLGSIVDGTGRPLTALAQPCDEGYHQPFLSRGASLPTLDRGPEYVTPSTQGPPP
jgi:V/A-type H+/Na+-transporting ATPase subunit A